MKKVLPLVCLLSAAAIAQSGGELRFCLRSEPKTFNPMLVADEPSEIVRYLTGGVLVRLDRRSQELQAEIASSWRLSRDGRQISFRLRPGLLFSDGTPFSAEDVADSVRKMLDPALKSPTGDAFRAGGAAEVTTGANAVTITFARPIAGLDRLFDQVVIVSSRAANPERISVGPFYIADYRPGAEVLLRRNPHYWKRDQSGRPLPYLESIRLLIQQNREMELLRFRRGEVDLINDLAPDMFERLKGEDPSLIRDAGPALDFEVMWFNQAVRSPIPSYKKAWFASRAFRQAVSSAINRADIIRVVYRGHAQPSAGTVSPANRFWHNTRVRPHSFDTSGASKKLEQAGFRRRGDTLHDAAGNPVEFSLITNAGNKSRERMAVMIQQDLAALGIRVNVTPLEFLSLAERISRSFDYEACLLGWTNVDVDPNGQMNLWLSSASNHQWNPSQPKPATPWEAEIDRLITAQSTVLDPAKRKEYFDKVQQIAAEEVPLIFLVHKNYLLALSPALRNAAPASLRPQAFWNIERLAVASQAEKGQ